MQFCWVAKSSLVQEINDNENSVAIAIKIFLILIGFINMKNQESNQEIGYFHIIQSNSIFSFLVVGFWRPLVNCSTFRLT